MSRPAWLYEPPMDTSIAQKCLLLSSSSSSGEASPITTHHPEVTYEWHYFSNNSTAATTTATANSNQQHQQQKHKKMPKQRLLIAQYVGGGKYMELLQKTASTNLAYARRWGHDVVLLKGTALQFPGIDPSCPNEPRSTFNKIPMLELALQQNKNNFRNQNQNQNQYDQVLILDTDAMIVDLDTDITALLLSGNDKNKNNYNSNYNSNLNHALVAHRVWKYDWRNTWDINAGVTLWNLHHPLVPHILQVWKQKVVDNPMQVLTHNDDQYFLQRTLLELGFWNRWRNGVLAIQPEFQYYDGTLIKHFLRQERSWTTTGLEQRLERIQESINQICQTWKDACPKATSTTTHDTTTSTSTISSPFFGDTVGY